MARAKITMPGGQTVEGEEVEIDDDASTERWSDYKLKDGTLIRLKSVVSSIIRLDGQYDGEGNPLYVVKSTPAVTIKSVPDKLRKPQN
jgi:hypothetical protein